AVDADGGNLGGPLEDGELLVHTDQLGDRDDRRIPDLGARGAEVVAEDQNMRQGTVQEGDGDAAEPDMIERTLALDDNPFVADCGLHDDLLDGAGHEVAGHAVDRDAMAGDQHAALAGSSEAGADAAAVGLVPDLQSGGLLADVGVTAAGVDDPAIQIQDAGLVEP